MKLDRLQISGFNHFGAMEIDFRTLPAGLIAVIGPNGSGKTSMVLEGPFACVYGPGVQTKAFPSREGTLFQYATSRNAYIDTLWQLEGRGQVRCRVNVDGERRKADAVLEEIGPDGVGHPVNINGLVPAYRDAVTERFPSQRSLLASAFASQNRRGGFGELGQKERSELFAELADLSHLEEKATIAKRCQQIAESAASTLKTTLTIVERDASAEALEACVNRLTRLAAELTEAQTARDAHVAAVDRLEIERAALASEAERYAAAVARSTELQTSVATARAAVTAQERAIEGIGQELQRTLSAISDRHTDAVAGITRRRSAAAKQYETAQADRRERLTNNRELVEKGPSIRAAVTRRSACDQEILVLRSKSDDVKQQAQAAAEQIRVRQAQLATITAAVAELADVRRRADLISTVKFGDACGVDPVCPLVTDAVAARLRIPALEGQVSHAQALREGVAHMRTAADIDRSIGTLQEEAVPLEPRAKLAPYLDQALARIAEYERDIASSHEAHGHSLQDFTDEEINAGGKSIAESADVTSATDARMAEATARLALLLVTASDLEMTIGEAQHDVAHLSGTRARIGAVTLSLSESQQGLTATTFMVARLSSERDSAIREQAQITSRRLEAASVHQKLRQAENEGLAWETLARACGRDGLQRLEIDAAGPVVSDLTNQLLEVGYGARFQVQLVTEVPTADKKDTKERIAMLVHDNDHGGEARDLGDLSGGERVIVEEAIRAALSCYVAMRSREPIRTVWRDECTGALSPENAPKYVALLRKMQAIAGIEHVVFITHSMTAAALADAQIHILNGTARVEFPPFQEAA